MLMGYVPAARPAGRSSVAVALPLLTTPTAVQLPPLELVMEKVTLPSLTVPPPALVTVVLSVTVCAAVLL